MKNKFCWDGTKERLCAIAALILCILMVILPLVGLRAYAEGSTVVEVMDENGNIVEMGNGDGTVILEDPALLEENIGENESVPNESEEPEATLEPDVDFEPTSAPTAEPETTQQPEASASPDPTAEPEATQQPEATEAPAESPEPTEEPEVTPLPTIEPTEEPTAHPSISPDEPENPFPAYSIQIAVPTGWSGADSEKVKIYITDEGGTGWNKIEIRLAGGEWIDAIGASGGSAELNVDVKRNGLLVVRMTDPDGEYHSEQAEITCFDRNAPEVTAGVNDQMLHVETSDGQSGVAGIQVNGLLFTTLENGKLDVRIMELLTNYRQLVVRAYDYAGNFSDPVTIDNPYYAEEESCATPKPTKKPSGSGSGNKATAKPKATATPTPTVKPTATPAPAATAVPTMLPVSTPSVIYTMAANPTAAPAVMTEYIPLGPGQPFKGNGNMQTLDMLYSAATNKQFITVQTRSGDTYYLVIDYDKPIDEEAEIYETYLLNLVDNRDLLSVLAEDEMPTPTPTPVVVYVTPEPTEVPAMQTDTQNNGNDQTVAMMAMMIIMVCVFAVLWFFKGRSADSKKNRNIIDDYEFDDGEEEL